VQAHIDAANNWLVVANIALIDLDNARAGDAAFDMALDAGEAAAKPVVAKK
jgi:thiamine kinase-like enzyme